jgi:hypothetical protein
MDKENFAEEEPLFNLFPSNNLLKQIYRRLYLYVIIAVIFKAL